MSKITNEFKTKLYNYFIKSLGAYQYKHGWMKLPVCPFCHREHKMGINLSMYRTNCFRCNYHMNPAQLVMDVEGFDTYAELLKFLDNGNFTDKAFSEEKIELSDAKPVYLPDGFKLINQGTSQVARSIRSYMSSRGFTIEELSKHGIGYVATEGPFLGTSLYPIIIKGRSGIIMPEMLLDRAQDTIIQIKILRDLERNSLSSIKMPSTCIAQYLSVREQSMHLLWETGLLPPWVRQSVLTKLTSLSNLQLIDLYYFWTLMPSNIQSTWLSNWSLIKRSRLYNCLKIKIVTTFKDQLL